MKKKLAIVTSHPIQYNAPWFKILNEMALIQFKVFYTWEQAQYAQVFDPGFNKVIKWDLPLLDGYEYSFIKNTAAIPGTHRFKGLINPTLNKDIEQWEPDALLIFGWAFKSHLSCIRYFSGKIPILFRGDSTLLDKKNNLKFILRKLFLTWVYSHIDYALFTGENNKEYFINNGVKESQMIFVPHAIDNNRFKNKVYDSKYQISVLRNQLGFSKNDIVLLFAGKLESKKNPFFLINLLKKMKQSNLKVLFVGNGVQEQSLKQAAVNDQRVVFLDFQNQQMMPIIYGLADIFILPSVGPGETWGLSLNEAMACAKPVVSSGKVGGAIDLIMRNVNGLIVENNETDELEALIFQAFKNKKILETMGIASEQIIQKYSFGYIVDALNMLMLKL